MLKRSDSSAKAKDVDLCRMQCSQLSRFLLGGGEREKRSFTHFILMEAIECNIYSDERPALVLYDTLTPREKRNFLGAERKVRSWEEKKKLASTFLTRQ